MSDMYSENRDMRCAADVGRMAALGRFDVEFEMYGCAYLQDGEITYRVTPDAMQLYQFAAQSVHESLYPTTVVHHIHRTPVPSGMQEQIANQTKLQLAKKLYQMYPPCFFTLLEPFTQAPANNNSYPLLLEMADAIDGHFNDAELQLLEGTMEIACQAKQLDQYGYSRLQQWLKKIRRQMEDDPIIQNNFSRTLYGFCYQTEKGTIKCTFDAQPVTVYERHTAKELEGMVTGQILQQTYWMKNFDAMAGIRNAFKELLLTLQNETYFQLLHTIQTLPGAIDSALFGQSLQQLATVDAPQAVADFRRFGRRWNAL